MCDFFSALAKLTKKESVFSVFKGEWFFCFIQCESSSLGFVKNSTQLQ